MTQHIAERRRQVVALYREGMTIREVGNALGVSNMTALRDLNAMGEPTRPPGWGGPRLTERNREIAETYMRGGISMRQLGAATGINLRSVHKHIIKYRALAERQS